MKILVVSESFTRGGLETQIKTYYDNLPKNTEMVFAFSNYTQQVALDNAKIYSGFKFSYYDTLKDICDDTERLVEIIKIEKIDLIHVHPFFSFFAALFASQITKTKLIYSYHGVLSFNFLETTTAAAIFKYAAEINAIAQIHSVSEAGIKCFENIGYKNAVFMPNPIDLNKFESIKYINNKKWALFSRLDNDKLPEIKLFLLNKDNFGIEFVDIYGVGANSEELATFISDNNLSNKVFLKGFCNNLCNTLNNSYNGVVGIGRVVLEGLAMGMPVFFIGYGKISGFINKELYSKIKLANFSNYNINHTNFDFPSDLEISQIQQDVKNNLSIESVMKHYVLSLQSAYSSFVENFSNLFYELKKLSENENFSNCHFLTDRAVYNIVRNYIAKFTLDSNINNMFVNSDLSYQLFDIMNLKTETFSKLLENQNTQILQLQSTVSELQRLEQQRFEHEEAERAKINKRMINRIKIKLSKLVNVYKKYGLIGFFKKLYAYIVANYLNKISFAVFFNPKKYRKQIAEILNSCQYDRIVLWRSSFGYNVPLFQRPQHIANNLTKNGCLVLYEVTTMTDKVKTLKNFADNLYLINYNNILLNKILMQELAKVDKPKYIQLYSTDWKLTIDNIKDYMANGYGFIYEYIDDISPELAGTKEIPQNIIDKYNFVMSNKDVFVVVTADLLKQDVISHRGEENLVMSSNGVDYSFFESFDKNFEFEPEFKEILKLGKPIVCYYGALAKWFDYDLIKKIAATNKYSVVLFGIKYDESFDENINGEKNIYFLGPRDYKVLKNYAEKCDILTIPFKINNITRATSPVKVFEYMALHKPIVTTDMNECRKYKSVLIGEDHNDFIEKLDNALKLATDANYIALLDKEARENDWSMKAKAITNLISESENK